MALIRLDMTMSLDGYVTGPDDGPDAPMGVDGFRLFNWLDLRNEPGPSGEVYAEAMATRALISGRRTYELAGHWGGDHHDGVPIFVLTHHVPDEPPPGTVRFVTDVGDCAAQARTAAGEAGGDVMVHGSRCRTGAAAGRGSRRARPARRARPPRAGTAVVRQPARRAHRARPGALSHHAGPRGPRATGHTSALPRPAALT